MKKSLLLFLLLQCILVVNAKAQSNNEMIDDALAHYSLKNYYKTIEICDAIILKNPSDTLALRIRTQAETERYCNNQIQEYFDKALPALDTHIEQGSLKLLVFRSRLYRARAKALRWKSKDECSKYFSMALNDLTAYETHFAKTELTEYLRKDINRELASL